VTSPLSVDSQSRTRANWLPGTAHQQGALSVTLSAALWGLFWIPLRFLDEHGVTGLWAVVLVMSAVCIPSILVLIFTNKLNALKTGHTWFIGSALGLSIVLYFAGVIVSDVIRVIFLFYLLPIWTTLAARVIYKEPITRTRLVVIAMALSGLWLLLGGGNSLPVPSNIGDWCGLFAGITWGVSLAFIRDKEDADAYLHTACRHTRCRLAGRSCISHFRLFSNNTVSISGWTDLGRATGQCTDCRTANDDGDLNGNGLGLLVNWY